MISAAPEPLRERSSNSVLGVREHHPCRIPMKSDISASDADRGHQVLWALRRDATRNNQWTVSACFTDKAE